MQNLIKLHQPRLQDAFSMRRLREFFAQPDRAIYCCYIANGSWRLEQVPKGQQVLRQTGEFRLLAIWQGKFAVSGQYHGYSQDGHELRLELVAQARIEDARRFCVEWLQDRQVSLASLASEYSAGEWAASFIEDRAAKLQNYLRSLSYAQLQGKDLAAELLKQLNDANDPAPAVQIMAVSSATLSSASGDIALESERQAKLAEAKADNEQRVQQAQLRVQQVRQRAENELEQQRRQLQHEINMSDAERAAQAKLAELKAQTEIARAESELKQIQAEIAQSELSIRSAHEQSSQYAEQAELVEQLRGEVEQLRQSISELAQAKQSLQDALTHNHIPADPEAFARDSGDYSQATLNYTGQHDPRWEFWAWARKHSRGSKFKLSHIAMRTRDGGGLEIRYVPIGEKFDFSLKLSGKPDWFASYDELPYLTLVVVGTSGKPYLYYPCKNVQGIAVHEPQNLTWLDDDMPSFMGHVGDVVGSGYQVREHGPPGTCFCVATLTPEPVISASMWRELQSRAHLNSEDPLFFLLNNKLLLDILHRLQADAQRCEVSCLAYEVPS